MLTTLRTKWLSTVLLLSITFGILACFAGADDLDHSRLDDLYRSKDVTIVITDSGLGGLSVAAALEKGLREQRIFGTAHLVFVNALASRDYPYNMMKGKSEKLRVFDSALSGMSHEVEPDVILIACNTLSVIYPETEFARTTTVPVIGIVQFGVDLIAESLNRDSTGSAIILGTPTTVNEGTHLRNLAELGFAGDRLKSQACEMLESEIQADPASDIVRSMIDMYAYEALEKQSPSSEGDLTVGLCCTHYGFALEAFESVFAELTDRQVRVVDPNQRMADFMLRPDMKHRYDSATIRVEVISQAEIGEEEINSIGTLLRKVSGPTADAVAGYRLHEHLFSF